MSEFSRELTDLIQNLAAEVQASPDDQVSPQWAQIQELGLTAIGIAEAAGGSGGGLDDLVVVIRELARAGLATPIVEASAAAFTIGVAPQGTFDTIVINYRNQHGHAVAEVLRFRHGLVCWGCGAYAPS